MNTARYTFMSGMPGYMPDYNSGPCEFTSRRALAFAIRSELEMLDYPASLFAEVKIRWLWGFIKRHGASSAHVTIYHGDRVFEMAGLTEAEFAEGNEEA